MELNYLNSFKFYCNFTDLGPAQLCGRGMGVPHMHAHVSTYMHAHTHMYILNTHVKTLQMATNIFIMISIWMYVHMCSCMSACLFMYTHVWGLPPRSVKTQYVLNKSRYFNSV